VGDSRKALVGVPRENWPFDKSMIWALTRNFVTRSKVLVEVGLLTQAIDVRHVRGPVMPGFHTSGQQYPGNGSPPVRTVGVLACLGRVNQALAWERRLLVHKLLEGHGQQWRCLHSVSHGQRSCPPHRCYGP
jgi:hypothetical protein